MWWAIQFKFIVVSSDKHRQTRRPVLTVRLDRIIVLHSVAHFLVKLSDTHTALLISVERKANFLLQTIFYFKYMKDILLQLVLISRLE